MLDNEPVQGTNWRRPLPAVRCWLLLLVRERGLVVHYRFRVPRRDLGTRSVRFVAIARVIHAFGQCLHHRNSRIITMRCRYGSQTWDDCALGNIGVGLIYLRGAWRAPISLSLSNAGVLIRKHNGETATDANLRAGYANRLIRFSTKIVGRKTASENRRTK